MIHDVWVEVDLAALRHNLRQVRGTVGDNVKIAAVVKGNGFGHGYIEPSRAFIQAGADSLAVTRIEEALPLRKAGITAPIMLFAPVQPANADEAVAANLDITITSVSLAQAISDAGEQQKKLARVYVKVDTGMGRLGVLPVDVPAFFQSIRGLPNIAVIGIYTHFATAADADISLARNQLRIFQRVLEKLEKAGFDYGIASAANSSAILRLPESRFDMVRPGTLLYGQYPSPHVPHSLDLKPTWKLKARVCEVKTLPKGTAVGYGAEYTLRQSTRTAVIPIGYADGFTLIPEGPVYRQSILKFAAKKRRRQLSVEIRGRKAKVIGRVAMQMIVVDVTGINGVEVGDEVTIPAMRIPTNALIPRVYVDSDA